jgi:NhaP-type Na+/H+ or K+/H+ antiporter
LIFAVRPIAVFLGVLGSRTTMLQRCLIGWFGIRGAGSIYYLAYAIQQGLDDEVAANLTSITLIAVTASVLLHGCQLPR